jgi:methionyl-tRNA synthetase
MKFIITAALPYSYSVPHLGNFVGSVLPADVYYRYLKMRGNDAIFICGSDQHGTPVELRAIKEKADPKLLADKMHTDMKRLFERFGCGFTHYGNTDSDECREIVYQFFEALRRNGYIKEIESEQAYCTVDKRFLPDRFIEGQCPYCGGNRARGDQCDDCGRLLDPAQILNPRCNICGKSRIEFRKAKNLAIELEKLEDKIEEFVAETSKNNWTKNAVNKSISFIKEGLKARAITRNMRWGFPVPLKGFEDSVFYVWFDNVISYIGITKEWDGKRWKDYWKDDKTALVHFMGKDNIEFHTILWPAYLIGADLGYVMPRTIRASEFLTSKEVKFSKSQGVGLNMQAALEVMDSDYWRFVLMHLYPETADSEFSIEVAREAVDKLMNDKIGNLIQRVLKITTANKGRLASHARILTREEEIKGIVSEYYENFERIRLREALHSILKLADLGNEIMSEEQPWLLVKEGVESKESAEKFSNVISTLLVVCYCISLMLWPFTPGASERACGFFGEKKEPDMAMMADALENGIKVRIAKDFKPVFTKMDGAQLEKLNTYK